MNKKKIIIAVVVIIGLIGIIIGTTYAVFTYTRSGVTDNQITTGTVTMSYTEGQNRINITNATPMTDEAGKALSNDDQVFDFMVNITMSTSQNISYEVTAEKIPYEENGLNNEDVKLYLERSTDGTNYSEVMEPTNYTEMGSDIDNFGATSTEMRLDAGYVNKTTTYYYRLRMWVDEDYSMESISKKFSVKVNVYGKDGTYQESVGPRYVAPQTGETHLGIVYLDPTDLTKTCTLSDVEDNYTTNGINGASTEIKTGCMKWYIFDEDVENEKYKMILDHNTTASIVWGNYTTYELSNLKTVVDDLVNVSNWQIQPRLITATEVHEITNGPAGWNVSSSTSWYYFGSKNQTTYSSQTNNQKAIQNSYHWLFDNLYESTNYGGNIDDNNSYILYGSTGEKNIYGYMTSDYNADNVWSVDRGGNLHNHVAKTYNGNGIRPVITISKSVLD